MSADRVYKFSDKNSAKESFCDIVSQLSAEGVEIDKDAGLIYLSQDCFMIDHAAMICENHGGKRIIDR
jgi:hypothetical protein